MSRQLYVVTPTDTRVPATRVAATDLFDLGAQVAAHLTRHRLLHRGTAYDVQIGDTRGAIRQGRRTLTFTIAKES